jgi:hypothetical protein
MPPGDVSKEEPQVVDDRGLIEGVEAGLPPGFEVMDDIQSRELLAEAQAHVLARLGKDEKDEDLADHLAQLSAHAGEAKLPDLLRHLFRHRHLLARYTNDAQFRARVLADLLVPSRLSHLCF